MRRLGAAAVVVPITTTTFSLATLALRLGPAGLVGGALVGLAWGLALGRLAAWARRRPAWREWLPDATLALAVVATAMLIGGGLLYGRVARAVLAEPSASYAVLSAMMGPTVPYFIALNTAMETLVVPLAVYPSWDAPRRRPVVVAAALVYFAMRAWSYLGVAPARFEMASRPLSAEDVAWYRETLATDYRGLLNVTCLALFLLAALRPAPRGGPSGDRGRAATGAG